MKPKDLKPVFTWETRCPLIKDSVFYVPSYYAHYQQFTFPGWEEIFGNVLPIKIEYCSGNGDWIIQRSQQALECNWVAVEKRFDRVRKIWSKRHNAQINHLFIVCAEAKTFSSFYIPSGSVSEVFINFPDPWPKKRHEKHRLMKREFLLEVKCILKEKGKITFVTDDLTYLQETLPLLSNLFSSLYPFPYYLIDKSDYGSSYFETLWRLKGRRIYYTEFAKHT